MSSIRQKKFESVIQQELSVFFRENTRELCMGAMVSVTVVRVAPDLSYCKVYLSIFGAKDNQEVFKNIKDKQNEIRFLVGKKLGKSLRKIPEFDFAIDDSLDYAEEIDKLLKD